MAIAVLPWVRAFVPNPPVGARRIAPTRWWMTLRTPADKTVAQDKEGGASAQRGDEEQGTSRVIFRSAAAEGSDDGAGGNDAGGQPPTDRENGAFTKRLLGMKDPQVQDLMWKVDVSCEGVCTLQRGLDLGLENSDAICASPASRTNGFWLSKSESSQ